MSVLSLFEDEAWDKELMLTAVWSCVEDQSLDISSKNAAIRNLVMIGGTFIFIIISFVVRLARATSHREHASSNSPDGLVKKPDAPGEPKRDKRRERWGGFELEEVYQEDSDEADDYPFPGRGNEEAKPWWRE